MVCTKPTPRARSTRRSPANLSLDQRVREAQRGLPAVRPLANGTKRQVSRCHLARYLQVGIFGMTKKQQRVLLVEDNDVGVLLVDVLRGEGYLVDLATTTAEAWAHLDTHAYVLVIADWKLPDGDGTIIADAAAHLGATTVVMSGYLFQMPRGRADPHETLMKPIRPSELVDVVQRSVGKRSTGTPLPQFD